MKKSPTTHFPCILQLFRHTLLQVRTYPSQKQIIVIPEITSQVKLSHSPLFLGPQHVKGQFYMRSDDQEKKKIYISEKKFWCQWDFNIFK